ncbi:MAG: UPF0182 family protein [Chloroflexi bacterium]|nr:UPF0182 family protein [Chloroflexota bacterium]MQC47875.1 UPF0182 family protein [Chloroflexota bacterium]
MGFHDDRGNLGPPPEPFRINEGREMRSPVPLRWLALAAIAVVLYVTLNVLKSIYTNAMWFDSVEFGSVYRTVVMSRITLFAIGAVVAGVVIGLNVMIARRLAPAGFEATLIEEIDPEAVRKVLLVVLIAATLFLAVIFGSVAAGAWETVLLWMNGVEFGRTDVQFNRDISFYMFDLPAYQFFQSWLLGLVIVSAIGAGGIYALSMSFTRGEIRIEGAMRTHLSVLGGLAFLLIAANTYLGIFGLVNSPTGIVYGATYTDVNARLPVAYVLVALAAFAGLATIANAFLPRDGFRVPIFAVGLWVVGGLLGGVIYPGTVQALQVEPNERLREEQYISRNIEATRFAWGLEDIVETRYPANPVVTQADFDANPKTIENVRLLDPRPLRDTVNQIQAIRQFYQFTDIDVDRYVIDGEERQVMIATREMDISRVQDRNWTRERLQLTHGFGAVIAPVNEVLPAGLPRLITADIPPRSEVLPITTEGARIYFGELTNHYVIANTSEPQFDYPLGEGNAETSYTEDRGITLNSLARRIALAWELGDANLLISGQINSDSRLLWRRNIVERVSGVAPFLIIDSDPYAVVLDERIHWFMTGYTVSSSFPYSQPSAGVNYIRDAVKITVDAQTGDMVFYLIAENDPVATTWAKIFPDLFTPNSEMPDEVRRHLRYPEDIFKIQSQLYLRYHITNPDVFFIGEDVWNIPTERVGSLDVIVEPYYVTLTLPEEEDGVALDEDIEFVLIMPFTPRNRQNTVAWLAGRSDGEHYGAMRAYRFPTDTLVYGPAQIEARIDQNPGISQQFSLWNQSGSEVIRGNLLMIPVGSSFLFVEPIYLQAENSRLPELVRVIVANGNALAMERTLPHALDVVMGRRASSLPNVTTQTSGDPLNPVPGPLPDATPTPIITATPQPLPTGDLGLLLDQAQQASDATQAELNRLRALLEAIQVQLEQQTP